MVQFRFGFDIILGYGLKLHARSAVNLELITFPLSNVAMKKKSEVFS